MLVVAHNNMKPVLVEFVKKHHAFSKNKIFGQRQTRGAQLKSLSGLAWETKHFLVRWVVIKSSAGWSVAKNSIWWSSFATPLSSHPHAVDVSALLRICDTTSTLLATNPSTAHGVIQYLQIYQPSPMDSEMVTESDAVKVYQKTVMSSIKVDENSPRCPRMTLNSVRIKSKL